MATSTTKKTSSSATKRVNNNIEEETNTPVVPKEVDMSQVITVVNGFQGKLVYRSSRTGELFIWDEFGAEQEMELRELRNAKSSAKGFFSNNWFMFNEDDAWVVDYLGVGRYYKNAVSVESFDEIFEKSPKEIETIIGSMSPGQKKSVSYRARQLIAEGGIDSRRVITTLEKVLNTELIER